MITSGTQWPFFNRERSTRAKQMLRQSNICVSCVELAFTVLSEKRYALFRFVET